MVTSIRGDAPNTNRDEATLRIEIRAYSPDILIQAVESVKRIIQEKCDVYFCPQKPDFKQIEYTPPLINDPVIEEVVTHQICEFFGQMTEEKHENTASRGSTSSEDFAVVAPNGIPYAYWVLAVTTTSGGRGYENTPTRRSTQRNTMQTMLQ